MPFDQHFLLAAIAPRLISVGAASLDDWADPTAALLCCIEADRAYRLLGRGRHCAADPLPPPGAALRDGRIGFFLRPAPIISVGPTGSSIWPSGGVIWRNR